MTATTAAEWGLPALVVAAAAVAAALAVPPPCRWRSPARRDTSTAYEAPTGSTSSVDSGASKTLLSRRGAMHVAMALTAAGGVVVVLTGVLGLVLAPLVGAGVWRTLHRMELPATVRRRRDLRRLLPLVVDLMAAVLAAGAAPDAAVRVVARAVDGPMRDELLAVAARLGLGGAPELVWRRVGAHPELGPLGRALTRALESGAPVVDAMQRLGQDLRRDGQSEAVDRARAVGVKAALPLGLCLLPAFLLVGVVPLVAASLSTIFSL